MSTKFEKVERAYNFLSEIESGGRTFSALELAARAQLKVNSVRTYINKRWSTFLVPQGGGQYRPLGVIKLGFENFKRVHCQKFLGEEPLRPRYGAEIDLLIDKAKESALLGVSIYNNPTLKHRSYGYIVQMVIAWTALFHAIFSRKGVDYYYKEKDGSYKVVDGDRKAWELSKCITEFWPGARNPISSNLDFLIGLRNKIEHRYLPAIDLAVAGECQSTLTNFESVLTEHFGDYFSLDTALAISLQLSRISSQAQVRALKDLQTAQYALVINYIESYRNSLPESILNSQDYRLSVFMIPKVVSRPSAADLCVEFRQVSGGDTLPEDARIVLVKEKLGDKSRFRHVPKVVAAEVARRSGRSFPPNFHISAWKHFKVRPACSSADKENTDKRFCAWVEGADKYLYTDEWIGFLVYQIKEDNVYETIKRFRP